MHQPQKATIETPELLAPAGSPAALIAAVNGGADAVYLGMGELNARRGAENFTLETLAEGARFAHLRGARVYLTANIVVLPDEMRRAVDLIDGAWAAGVDAVIVQDLGLLRVLRSVLPHVRIHASTQIDAHNAASVRTLAELGCSRVTLARELSVAEIGRIARSVDVEVESFVHGSLCYCYSGQCLMSSVIGGRSANRGLCAQPCRMPYSLVRDASEVVEVDGRYLLSPRDLAGIGQLPALIRSGASALKIEGRMKAPEYVSVVVGVYRAALDRAAADPDGYQVLDAETQLLEEAFNRGFSEAYLAGISDGRMMNTSRPNNRGVLIGRISAVNGGVAEVALDRALDAADTIEFWTGKGRFAQRAGELRVRDVTVSRAGASERVSILLEGAAGPGDRVFRVANATMLEAARATFEGRDALEYRATAVRFEVRMHIGEPLTVTASGGGFQSQAVGPVVEPARTRAVSAEDVSEHVGRVGGSGYFVSECDVDLEQGAGIGFSVLHSLRREVLESLDGLRLARWQDRQRHEPVVVAVQGLDATRRPPVELVACVTDPQLASACLAAGADRVLVRVTPEDDASAVPSGTSALLPRIAHEEEMDTLVSFASPGLPLAAGNLGVLAETIGSDADVSADWPLNIVNPWAAQTVCDIGASSLWASHELTASQLTALAVGSPVPVGAVVYGRVELMVAERCVLQNAGGCTRRCVTCEHRQRTWLLRDEKGYEFPVLTDATGRSHIYNAVTLDLSRALPDVLATGVTSLRLDFSVEDAQEHVRVVSAYRAALNAAVAGETPPVDPVVSPATSGHFFRGVR
ncbi:MAG: U32 family peptidase [Coriobacteriia bacterium]|nr:U32 family peptidase [Coriobacteriia bacterium]MBN2822071.1 U32 family peptidase [Coriobacteriia bacterium]